MTDRLNSLILFILCCVFAITPALAEQKTNAGNITGTVKNVIDVTSYTYVEVATDTTTVWVAAPTTPIEIGSSISFSTQMPMEGFYSDSIKKTFPLIYFVSRLGTNADKKLSPHTQINPTDTALEGIDKIKDGKNIAEIYTEKSSLKGKSVKIRAKVTRFSASIMWKNWLHIQYSSTTKDLTVTTQNTANVGDIVIVEGKMALDKSFGNGYDYPIILEDAKISKNK